MVVVVVNLIDIAHFDTSGVLTVLFITVLYIDSNIQTGTALRRSKRQTVRQTTLSSDMQNRANRQV